MVNGPWIKRVQILQAHKDCLEYYFIVIIIEDYQIGPYYLQ